MRRALPKPRYISCLLRLWQTDDGGQYVWRVSLEYPASGERLGFASLADLFVYLESELGREDKEDSVSSA